jgi:1,4-alpha-glucan branching enzyme
MSGLSQANITPDTPIGATLIAGGATFKVWAPSASAVYLNGQFASLTDWQEGASPLRLTKDPATGFWTGFLDGVADGDLYKFWVVGPVGGSSGYKRDPYARELTPPPPGTGFPNLVSCIIHDDTYPWHDAGFVTPDFSNLIIYQLHVGAFAAASPRYGNFLDVVAQIPYFVALGINALQPLPITECEHGPSQGYDGTDYFSPDMVYTEYSPVTMNAYLATVNQLLAGKGQAALTATQIQSGPDQLKVMVDLCHLYGIAVFFDVVYNHAGGFDNDDESLYFLDRQATGDQNRSLYFIDQACGGGQAFALWKQEVQQFLRANASFLVQQFHVDGFRYDEISALLATNASAGWGFCQSLTAAVRAANSRALQNAEFWPGEDPSSSIDWVIKPTSSGGAGFDVVQHDALRIAVRGAIAATSYGASAAVDMTAIANTLYPPGFVFAWNAVTCVENHDIVHVGRDLRIPRLADGSGDSFYSRSRAKVATGLLLTAPGMPQLFMGQEFLESQQWDDNPANGNCMSFAQLRTDKGRADQLRFTQDLIRLRWQEPALRGQAINVFHVHDQNRVLAFQRWVEGEGRDVICVVNLADQPYFGYNLGFPGGGHWQEAFNSDVYENWVNPLVVGNYGGVDANGPPLQGLPASASVVLPPRALLVFTR